MWFLQVHNPIQLKTALLQKVSKGRPPQWSWFPASYPGRLFQGPSNKHRRFFLQFRKADFAILIGVGEGQSVLSLQKESHRQITQVCLGRWWRSRLAAQSNCEVRAFLDQITVNLVKILLMLLWHETLALCLNCNMGTVSKWVFCPIKLKSKANSLNLHVGENSTVLVLHMMGSSPHDPDRVRKLPYLAPTFLDTQAHKQTLWYCHGDKLPQHDREVLLLCQAWLQLAKDRYCWAAPIISLVTHFWQDENLTCSAHLHIS